MTERHNSLAFGKVIINLNFWTCNILRTGTGCLAQSWSAVKPFIEDSSLFLELHGLESRLIPSVESLVWQSCVYASLWRPWIWPLWGSQGIFRERLEWHFLGKIGGIFIEKKELRTELRLGWSLMRTLLSLGQGSASSFRKTPDFSGRQAAYRPFL